MTLSKETRKKGPLKPCAIERGSLGDKIEDSCMKKKNKKKIYEISSSYDGDGDGDGGVVVEEELMMYEILPRLPFKSLFRFKLVCKKWNNLIPRDSLFITTYHFHNKTNLFNFSFYFHKRDCVISGSHDQDSHFKMSKPLEFVHKRDCVISGSHYQDSHFKMFKPLEFVKRFISINGSTNGLLYGFCYQLSEIFVCNPITKHVVYIPNPKGLGNIALAADPYNNPNFGFAIIAMVNYEDGYGDDPNCYHFEVYSSKTSQWRMSNTGELRVPSHELSRKRGHVFIEGKVYWSLARHIVWFDIEEDVAGLVPCPNQNNIVFLPPMGKEGPYFEIGVCEGELSYSNMTKEGDIEIWLLRNNHNNNNNRATRGDDHQQEFVWAKRHNVRLQEIVQQNRDIMLDICRSMNIRNRNTVAKAFARRGCLYPLSYPGGKVVVFWMRMEGIGKVFSIDLRTQELKVMNHVDLPLPAWPFTPNFLPCPT